MSRSSIKLMIVAPISFALCCTASRSADPGKYQFPPPFYPIKILRKILEMSPPGKMVYPEIFKRKFHVTMHREMELPSLKTYVLKENRDWYFETSLWISQIRNRPQTYGLNITFLNAKMSQWLKGYFIDDTEATKIIESYGWKPTNTEEIIYHSIGKFVPQKNFRHIDPPPLPSNSKVFSRLDDETLNVSLVGENPGCINFISITGIGNR